MKKLSILFLLSNFRAGGAETQYANLIRNINRKKFNPTLAIIEYKNNTATREFLSGFGDVNLVRFRRNSKLDISVILRVRKYILTNHIDIVQAQLFMDNQIGRFAGIHTNVPVITSVRGEDGAINGPLKTWFEFNMQFLSAKVVVNSFWLRNYVENMGVPHEKIVPVYNGVDFTRYVTEQSKLCLRKKYNIPEASPVVSIVARLHEMKDHVTFFNSIKLLRVKYPDIIAIVVGEGTELVKLTNYVDKVGLAERVRFVGAISDGLSEIYKITDVLLLTSQWGESLPNVVLEAMSAAVPVVASNISAIPEIIEDGISGYTVEKKDANEFAEKASLLLSDVSLRERIIEQAKQKAQEFSIPIMVDRYEKLYTAVARA